MPASRPSRMELRRAPAPIRSRHSPIPPGAKAGKRRAIGPGPKQPHESGARPRRGTEGYSSKTVIGDDGAVEIAIPRDRNGSFEPQIVPKGQTRLDGFDDRIIETVLIAIKGPVGRLLDTAIPKVAITKDACSWDDDDTIDLEGLTNYGRNVSNARHRLMLRAVHSGLPVVRVGRGNTEGFVPLHDPFFIGGLNLTATNARVLLLARPDEIGDTPPRGGP